MEDNAKIKSWNYQIRPGSYGEQSSRLINRKLDKLLEIVKDAIEEERGFTDIEISELKQILKDRGII